MKRTLGFFLIGCMVIFVYLFVMKNLGATTIQSQPAEVLTHNSTEARLKRFEKYRDPDLYLPGLNPTLGFWKCIDGTWTKMFNPTHNRPEMSCNDIKTKQNLQKQFGVISSVANAEKCRSAGGFVKSNVSRCYFDATYPSTPCADSGECEGVCFAMKENHRQYLYFNMTETITLKYSVQPGHCSNIVGYGTQPIRRRKIFLATNGYFIFEDYYNPFVPRI